MALTTTFNSATSLQAQVPASDLSNSGTASVTVKTPAPGGGTSAALSFTISPVPNPAPSLKSLSPSSVVAGAPAFTLTVNGSGFVSGSQVLWNGSTRATAYVSSTSLSAQILATDVSSPGSASVSVENPAPGGGTSAVLTFTINPIPNPAPSLTSLSPASAVVGSPAFTLTLSGTNFVSGSQVLWNGSQRTTTYLSNTSLTAQISATDLSSPGTASVSVQNPSPGGGTSAAVSFSINAASTNLTVLKLPGSDLAWNAAQQKLYVSVPGDGGSNANTITVVDPIAGLVGTTQSLSSAPYGLAISDDSQFLYTAIGGGSTIQRLVLPGLAPDIQWSLGTDPYLGGANIAGDMKVQPGNAHTLAVSFGDPIPAKIAIFDDGVARAGVANGQSSLQWKSDGTELYSSLGSYLDNQSTEAGTDTGVYTFSVDAAGVTSLDTFGHAFRSYGFRLHSDPVSGNLYSDWGEVVNPGNGVPVGNYRFARPDSLDMTGPLAILDPTLHRFFILLEVSEPDGSDAYQIQAYDPQDYHLLSTIVVPNATGFLQNFIRWGQSGLAFISDLGGTTAPGMLYILDGAFVNPSGVQDTTAGAPLTLVPTVTSLTPITAVVGSEASTLTVNGHDFVGQPTVYWNGNPLQTTLVSNTQVQAQIPASDLAIASKATITVSNTASGIPASNALTFSVNPVPPSGNQVAVYSTGGNDLVWDANAKKIYVSMPGVQGEQGDSIGIVDPVAGTVSTTGFLGSDPANLAISSDGNLLYAAFYGQNAIEQLTLPDFTVNNTWNLGADSFSGPYYPLALEPAPAAPQTTAVILAWFDVSPPPVAIVIYDGATPRPTELPVTAYRYSSLQWAGTDTSLYSVDGVDFLVLGASPSGVTLNQPFTNIENPGSFNIRYDAGTGLIYTDGGQVIQPSDGSTVGNYGASGMLVPDSTLDRVFILGQTSAQSGTSNYTIESFDQTKMTPIGSINIDNVVGTPTALIRWGTNGLAFTTRVGAPADFNGIGPGQLYVISGTFVNPSGSAVRSSVTAPISPVHRTWNDGSAPSTGHNRR